MTSKRLIRITFPILALIVLYFIGPSPDKPKYDQTWPIIPADAESLEKYISTREQLHQLKKDNEARIVWNDSTRKKTPYAIVYLHGFSASQKEGDPVHLRLAKEYGCNLYLSRLSDHGVDTTESLQLFTADRIWNSAKEALAIGNQLGEKVIIVSTSTGGTLALKLAADFPDKVHAMINLSPNIAINNPAAFLLNDPWGLQIARMVMGGKYRVNDTEAEKSQYWNGKYRLESVVQLEELVESTTTKETFHKVTQPTLTLYYYRDDEHQDPEVKVSAMIKMNEELGTPDSLKEAKAIPNAEAHVLGGSLASKDVETVYHEMSRFVSEKLHLPKAGS